MEKAKGAFPAKPCNQNSLPRGDPEILSRGLATRATDHTAKKKAEPLGSALKV